MAADLLVAAYRTQAQNQPQQPHHAPTQPEAPQPGLKELREALTPGGDLHARILRFEAQQRKQAHATTVRSIGRIRDAE